MTASHLTTVATELVPIKCFDFRTINKEVSIITNHSDLDLLYFGLVFDDPRSDVTLGGVPSHRVSTFQPVR